MVVRCRRRPFRSGKLGQMTYEGVTVLGGRVEAWVHSIPVLITVPCSSEEVNSPHKDNDSNEKGKICVRSEDSRQGGKVPTPRVHQRSEGRGLRGFRSTEWEDEVSQEPGGVCRKLPRKVRTLKYWTKDLGVT